MRVSSLVLLLVSIVLAAGCSTTTRDPRLFLGHFDVEQHPSIEDFETCASAGCRKRTQLCYTESEWQSIRTLFEPTPQSAAEERKRLLVAVAAMETLVGEKNGTSGDHPRNRRRGSKEPQLDCIAEAANTTVALLLLEQDHLLQFHRVSYPQHRGFAHLEFPHNSAAIIEHENGAHYVIDSWFFANGEPPICVTVDEWKNGYDPEQQNQHYESL